MTNGRKRLTWEETALKLAFNIAEYRSEDPYCIVGCCGIKYDKSIVLAYNGAVSGINIDWSNRDERRKRVLHAEENLLNLVKPNELEFIAITHLPCKSCIRLIAQKKIPLVIYSGEMEKYDNELTKQLATEFRIELRQIKY